jgi:hypothetical protein
MSQKSFVLSTMTGKDAVTPLFPYRAPGQDAFIRFTAPLCAQLMQSFTLSYIYQTEITFSHTANIRQHLKLFIPCYVSAGPQAQQHDSRDQRVADVDIPTRAPTNHRPYRTFLHVGQQPTASLERQLLDIQIADPKSVEVSSSLRVYVISLRGAIIAYWKSLRRGMSRR